jgi:hypothetical protein
MKQKPLKQKKCKSKQCGKLFTPAKPLQCVCDWRCAIAHNEVLKEKKKRATELKSRRETKQKLDKLKGVRELTKETQPIFNLYIRMRDADQPCISCGRYFDTWDCGHFLGVGARPDLRFDEMNAHKQCKSCNSGSGNHARKRYTVAQDYRIKLIERIGLAEVERLEGPYEPKRYREDELNQLKIVYRQKIKELKANGN